MGGLKSALPVTYWTFLIGALAIAGVPGLSGFFSKDEILYRTYASGHTWMWAFGLLTSFLTAIYMFRLVYLAFHGPRSSEATAAHHAGTHGDEHGGHLHDAPRAMAATLIVLAAGAVVAGYVGVPHVLGGSNQIERFLAPSFGQPEAATEVAGPELALMTVSIIVAVAGISIATFFFLMNRRAADAVASRFAGLNRLLERKYYVDELYEAVVVKPIRMLSEAGLWKIVDVRIIDGAVNGVGEVVDGGAEMLRRMQSGSVRVYAASVFVGVVVILGYYVWR